MGWWPGRWHDYNPSVVYRFLAANTTTIERLKETHGVLVTSLCEPRPWPGGTSVGFMNYRSWWRQRKQELRLQQCPKPPTCTSAPIHEDNLSHPNPCKPNFLLCHLIRYFLLFTFNAFCKYVSPNFVPFTFMHAESFITLSHITRSISLDFYECFYLCAFWLWYCMTTRLYAYCCIVDNDLYFLWDPPWWMPFQN